MEKYIHYLYALVRGKVDFLAARDIFSQKKQLIYKVGDTISAADAKALIPSKLLHSFEESIQLKTRLHPDELLERINLLVESDQSLLAIDNEFGHANLLKDCCQQIKELPSLMEIVSLYAIERPILFEQSLYSAYLVYIFGLASKYTQPKIESLFLAGLLHDVGLLFIPRRIVDKRERLSGDEWAKMQLHPIIAYKMLAHIDGFPKTARRSILDHHECIDGSGYCMKKSGDKIDRAALVVSILDDVVAIYLNKLKPLGRTLADIQPTLQMNTHGYPNDILNTMLLILKQVDISEVSHIELETLHAMVEYTYQQQLYINKFFDVLERISATSLGVSASKKMIFLRGRWERLSQTITSSGVQESNYMDWLLALENESGWKALYNEIEFSRLMLEEVIYELNAFFNSANASINRGVMDVSDNFSVFIHIYSVTPRPIVPKPLQSYWDTRPYE